MNNKAFAKREAKSAKALGATKQVSAAEFKAKCLGIMQEISQTGRPLIVTKRGKPMVRVVPIGNGKKKKDDFFGRLVGIIEIVGDPDDLIKPVFPLEDYDMLK